MKKIYRKVRVSLKADMIFKLKTDKLQVLYKYAFILKNANNSLYNYT